MRMTTADRPMTKLIGGSVLTVLAAGLLLMAAVPASAAAKPTPTVTATAASTITVGHRLTVDVTVEGAVPVVTTSSKPPTSSTSPGSVTTPTTPTTAATSSSISVSTTRLTTSTPTTQTTPTTPTTPTTETTPTTQTTPTTETTETTTTTDTTTTTETTISSGLTLELRAHAAAFAAVAITNEPGSGTVTVYTGNLALGSATLDGSGHAVIDADTSALGIGSYSLRVGYAGSNVFSSVSIGVPLAVEGSSGSTSAPTSVATTSVAPTTQQVTTTTVTELASTGFSTPSFVAAALILLVAGVLLLVGLGRRPQRRH